MSARNDSNRVSKHTKQLPSYQATKLPLASVHKDERIPRVCQYAQPIRCILRSVDVESLLSEPLPSLAG